MKLKEQIAQKRDDVVMVARKYGATNIRLFGSVARGEERPDSDIDFLVDLQPGRSIFDLGGLLIELEALFARSVDVITESGIKPRMKERILKEVQPV
jgi:predicted nucleotidyltransferase